MAEEGEKNKNKLIAIIAGAVLVIAAVVIAIVVINKNKGEVLDDNFFKTSDSKIVISNASNSTDPAVAKKVHQVYTIDGDKITGLKVYSEFESEQAAKDADSKPEIEEAMKSGNYKDHKVQGKFIIVTMNDSMYQGLTVDQLKMTAEALEKAIQSGTDAQSQQQTEQTEQTEQKEQSTEQTEQSTEQTEKNTEESTEATEESEE
ncbi:hypothetical protein IKD57_03100 [Candidatus Saccharibacteria bacterium]|nr:hypothetical protein [Candidatus Saccharibacteria bacterium]